MFKVTVLYGHPTDAEAFEKYYYETHIPIASKMQNVTKVELTKYVSAPDGSKPAYYRMAELYFSGEDAMQQSMDSPEGQATVADLSNFATGGITVMIGPVEELV